MLIILKVQPEYMGLSMKLEVVNTDLLHNEDSEVRWFLHDSAPTVNCDLVVRRCNIVLDISAFCIYLPD